MDGVAQKMLTTAIVTDKRRRFSKTRPFAYKLLRNLPYPRPPSPSDLIPQTRPQTDPPLQGTPGSSPSGASPRKPYPARFCPFGLGYRGGLPLAAASPAPLLGLAPLQVPRPHAKRGPTPVTWLRARALPRYSPESHLVLGSRQRCERTISLNYGPAPSRGPLIGICRPLTYAGHA